MLNIVMYQMNPKVGDLYYNLQKITDFYLQYKDCDLILTPELSLCGYSPFDDLFCDDFKEVITAGIKKIINLTINNKAKIILGTPYYEKNKIYNVLLVIGNGEILEIIYKSKLPNYGVFNEVRYFATKKTKNIVTINNIKIGIFLCEDMWHKDKILEVLDQKPQICISINASVFERDKHNIRLAVAKQVYDLATHKFSLIYLNNVGAVDDVVFDGNSFVMDENAKVLSVMGHCTADVLRVYYNPNEPVNKISTTINKQYTKDENYLNYGAINMGLTNFMEINGFEGVILGLSGGIDSVISATMCADILGADKVIALSMPTKYTSALSKDIIKKVVKNLGIKLIEIPIDDILNNYETNTKDVLDLNANAVGENLQARIRGNLLMALSNQYPKFMVLTTGNKSEIATGYSTLYGDSCGAFNLLKDLYKTQVFSLARYLNVSIAWFSKLQKFNLIPRKAINRKPSAELKYNQFDEDNLMEYNILDKIIYDVVEKNLSLSKLYHKYNKDNVDKVLKLLKNSHHKRVQSATGVKLSSRSFSAKEYQYPISTAYKINNKLN